MGPDRRRIPPSESLLKYSPICGMLGMCPPYGGKRHCSREGGPTAHVLARNRDGHAAKFPTSRLANPTARCAIADRARRHNWLSGLLLPLIWVRGSGAWVGWLSRPVSGTTLRSSTCSSVRVAGGGGPVVENAKCKTFQTHLARPRGSRQGFH